MRKGFSLLVVGALAALALSACGGNGVPNGTLSATSTPSAEITGMQTTGDMPLVTTPPPGGDNANGTPAVTIPTAGQPPTTKAAPPATRRATAAPTTAAVKMVRLSGTINCPLGESVHGVYLRYNNSTAKPSGHPAVKISPVDPTKAIWWEDYWPENAFPLQVNVMCGMLPGPDGKPVAKGDVFSLPQRWRDWTVVCTDPALLTCEFTQRSTPVTSG